LAHTQAHTHKTTHTKQHTHTEHVSHTHKEHVSLSHTNTDTHTHTHIHLCATQRNTISPPSSMHTQTYSQRPLGTEDGGYSAKSNVRASSNRCMHAASRTHTHNLSFTDFLSFSDTHTHGKVQKEECLSLI